MPNNSIPNPSKSRKRSKPELVQFLAIINGNNFTVADRSQLDAFVTKYSSANSIYQISLFRVEFFNLLENGKSL
jgi:hypothetical protein